MSSKATLRWASMIGTLLLSLLAVAVVASAPRPSDAPLHPSVKQLPDQASVQTSSYVS
jgi:hypothetical protein